MSPPALKKSGFDAAKEEIVNIYLDPSHTLEVDKVDRVQIPLGAIERMEVYDVDLGTTVFATVGGISGTVGCVFMIILLTKQSCPFVSAHNEEGFEFSGEIYSGAIYPPLERHDYLPLSALAPVD